MKVITLASGSKANSTYIESGETRLIFDFGLSCKATVSRLEEIGIMPISLSGIFISHEHLDHCRGLKVFSKKYNVPIYANEPTAQLLENDLRPSIKIRRILSQEEIKIGEIKVHPFSVPHNSADPLGFTISAKKKKAGILTDCGYATGLIKQRLKDVDLLLIESNYDEGMLTNSSYPWSIKQRIRGRLGHLSNKDAAALIAELFEGRSANVILGHISENTNTFELADNAVKSALRGNGDLLHQIYSAPRDKIGQVHNL